MGAKRKPKPQSSYFRFRCPRLGMTRNVRYYIGECRGVGFGDSRNWSATRRAEDRWAGAGKGTYTSTRKIHRSRWLRAPATNFVYVTGRPLSPSGLLAF